MPGKTQLDDHAEIYNRNRQDIRPEKEKWKEMNKKERATYFKEYYLKKLIIGGICCAMLISILCTVFGPSKDPDLYIAVVDYAANQDACDAMHKGLLNQLGLKNDKKDSKKVLVDHELYVNADNNLTVSTTQKLITYLMAGTVDVMIAPSETFDQYAYKGYFSPLSEELPTQLFNSLTDNYYYNTSEDDESEQAYGIRLKVLDVYDSNNNLIVDPVVGIVVNSKHKKNALKAFEYLTETYLTEKTK